jgi:serine/threonine protein phosphatase PrpC
MILCSELLFIVYIFMISFPKINAKTAFEYVLPPLTVGSMGIAIYQISQQKFPSSKQQLALIAGVIILGSLVLCATNKKAQELFNHQFSKSKKNNTNDFPISSGGEDIPGNYFPDASKTTEVIATEFIMAINNSTEDILKDTEHLREEIETLQQGLCLSQLDAKNLRSLYFKQPNIKLEKITEKIRLANENIQKLEFSIFNKLEDLEKNHQLQENEQELLRFFKARVGVHQANHKILNEEEIESILTEQSLRSKIQSVNEKTKLFKQLSQSIYLSDYCNIKGIEIPDVGSLCYYTTFQTNNAAICKSQGVRDYMEDETLVTYLSIKKFQIPLLGIFDGHSSSKGKNSLQASSYVKERLAQKLEKKIEYFLSELFEDTLTDPVLYNAMHQALIELHEEYPGINGTTVNISVIANGAIYTANIGDSRSIFVDSQGNWIQLTEDAKPHDPRHKKIIEDLGGFVKNGRVSNRVSMGSALGDPEVLGINPTVDITKTLIPEGEGILLMASDGLWDVTSSENACHELYENRYAKQTTLAAAMMNAALDSESKDNISIIVYKISA